MRLSMKEKTSFFQTLLPGLFSFIPRSFSNNSFSIRTKILFSFFLMILLMGTVNASIIILSLQYKYQYDNLLQNITTANSINGSVKPTIDGLMRNIVVGKLDFRDGQQYRSLDYFEEVIRGMEHTTDSDMSRLKLDVILRTTSTLRTYMEKIDTQLKAKKSVAENEAALENVYLVTELIDADIQEYVLFEINQTQKKYLETQANFTRWAIFSILAMSVMIILAVISTWLISESIYTPIKKLQNITRTIADKDLEALINPDNKDEIAQLGSSFNAMVGRIRELLDNKLKEQENLKKYELKMLQVQINPHFLYNTLDSIIWMARANQNTQVIEMVSALSNFFRVTLSKGRDWIKIQEEVEHVRSYLSIQKMRYQDILDFYIEMDEAILGGTILNLTLQPLVENALYHGIKNRRNGGTIWVRGSLKSPDLIFFEVEDDGIGFSADRLAQVRAGLADDKSPVEVNESGFGINNVNKRIKLYYGEQYGLSIESEHLKGTRISLVIPLVRDPNLSS
jgi:two-component system, sensor histidine kinase YesM